MIRICICRSRDTGAGIIFPGSFNPFHGASGLLDAAIEVVVPGCLELSIENADKPALNLRAVVDRLAGMPEEVPVVLTRSATFLEKAELFPGAWFAGLCAAMRLLDPRYHADAGDVKTVHCIRESVCCIVDCIKVLIMDWIDYRLFSVSVSSFK